MKLPVYLDYMASTPVDNAVAEKMLQYLTESGDFGNPTSSHEYGRKAMRAVEQARIEVANLINAQPREIIWTSGATESNNLAIKGAARFYSHKGKHLITLKTEHKAVLDPCKQLEREGFTVTYLTPQTNGLLSIAELQAAIRPDTILVSIMQVNNEIGVIQDIHAIGALTRQHGIVLHVDAAQSVGKIPLDVTASQVDLMSLSAHKLYGPKGIGALYMRYKPKVRLEALIHRGGHEHGLRAGTLATHQIVGMGTACQLAQANLAQESARILHLRNQLWHGLCEIPGIKLNGDLAARVPGNLNVSFAGIDGEALLYALKDLAISNASACVAASIEPSHVLRALGLPDVLAHSALRISIGRYTTEQQIEYAIAVIKQQIQRLRSLAPHELF